MKSTQHGKQHVFIVFVTSWNLPKTTVIQYRPDSIGAKFHYFLEKFPRLRLFHSLQLFDSLE